MSREFSSYQPVKNYNTFVTGQRYTYAEVVVDGQAAFLKQANSPAVAPKLQRELLWHDYMADFSAAHPEPEVRSPRIIEASDMRILFEFVDAPSLATADDISALEPDIPRLAQLMLAMDAFAADWTPSRTPNPDTDNAPYDNIDKEWRSWAANPSTNGVITEAMLSTAADILSTYKHWLSPRMQHGDFNPWHIFNKDGQWIIFDGEDSSANKARFYDLAYFYSRVFTHGQSHAIPAKLLTEFKLGLDMSEDEFLGSFLPLLTSRALGIFIDAVHDKPQVDYMADAIELFERCKSRDINALIRV